MNTNTKRRPFIVALGLLFLCVLIGGLVLLRTKLNGEPSKRQIATQQQEPLSAEELVDVLHKARVAVGHLENDRLTEAHERFVALLKVTPDEPIVVRNLAITRLELFRGNRLDSAPVEEALEALRSVEPDAATTYWLLGQAKVAQANATKNQVSRERFEADAWQAFERAAEIEPNNPAYAYWLYDLTRFADSDERGDEGYAALLRAYELGPDNLFILTALLSAQATLKDPRIEATITAARRVLAPLASTIETRTKINVVDMLDQAGVAASMGEWAVVNRHIAPLMGTVRSEEVARSDWRRIDIDPLDAVVHQLSDALMASYPSQPDRSLNPEIRFETLDLGEPASRWSDVFDARVVDFDLDDKPDLVVLREGRLEAYRLTEQGKVGAQITSTEIEGDFHRLLIADLDEDTLVVVSSTPSATVEVDEQPESCFRGDGDVVVVGPAGFRVFSNEISGSGENAARVLQPIEQPSTMETNVAVDGAVLVDMDHDGDLDVVASTEQGIRLWSNRGKLLFEDLSRFSILPPPEWQFRSLAIVDWDRDVDIDLVLSGTNGSRNGILESLRHGQFRWRPFDEELQALSGSTAVLPLEVDGNASWDLAGVGEAGVQLVQTKTLPAASVTAMNQVILSPDKFANLLIGDFDNSGTRDLLTWGESLGLFRGNGGGQFQRDETALADWQGEVQHCEAADLDSDGDLDLVVITDRKLRLLMNQGGSQGNYLVLHCRGEQDNVSGRVNHWGIGSLVELKAGNTYQVQTVTSDTTHFGLGTIAQADVARVLWTQGVSQSYVEPASNQIVCESMMVKSSCPYAYTWNGNRFEFFTDLLWNAPLGLQLADGIIAPDRPWEYLKLPGEKLEPKGRHYELRITEELWEAGYFDQVELMAVDHPSEIELYTNEKVGPAAIAEHRIHTVRQRQYLKSVTDQKGRDWLSALERADGAVVKAFDATYRQGLAEPHFLELDFGDLGAPRTIMLFLTGWIRPPDSSLNVALSHHPQLSPPKPPSVWVPDDNGQWREALPYMGFPGGKTKTIAVDVSKLFSSSNHRMRIQTTAEIYWDEAFFTVDEVPADLRLSPLELVSADLHYRGFSQAIVGPRTVPDSYDYDRVDKSPRWPPMRGPLTRLGDVRPLLEETDSQLVVMGSGDEIRLRFKAPDVEMPAGWKRDFILHNVGWDKDADLNTVASQSVEPLPFIGMEGYPYVESDLIDNESYRDYLRTYQTRVSGRDAFWRELLPD